VKCVETSREIIADVVSLHLLYTCASQMPVIHVSVQYVQLLGCRCRMAVLSTSWMVPEALIFRIGLFVYARACAISGRFVNSYFEFVLYKAHRSGFPAKVVA
jgi:hypothetical protein